MSSVHQLHNSRPPGQACALLESDLHWRHSEVVPTTIHRFPRCIGQSVLTWYRPALYIIITNPGLSLPCGLGLTINTSVQRDCQPDFIREGPSQTLGNAPLEIHSMIWQQPPKRRHEASTFPRRCPEHRVTYRASPGWHVEQKAEPNIPPPHTQRIRPSGQLPNARRRHGAIHDWRYQTRRTRDSLAGLHGMDGGSAGMAAMIHWLCRPEAAMHDKQQRHSR